MEMTEKPLNTSEELEKQLQRSGAGWEQLLETNAAALLKKLPPTVDADKITALLGRGFMLSMAVETWQGAGVWVTSRNESDYPERLHRLKQNAPPLIYRNDSIAPRVAVLPAGCDRIDHWKVSSVSPLPSPA